MREMEKGETCKGEGVFTFLLFMTVHLTDRAGEPRHF